MRLAMSYSVQQQQNWLISWLFIWFNMVSVRFLGSKYFIQPLLLSDYSINHCFNNMLEQQGIALRKIHLHINPKYFDWMVFVISIFQLLAESRRNKHEGAWPNYLSTSMGSLIWQDSLWSCFISCYMWHIRPSTQEILLSSLLQWNFEPDQHYSAVPIVDL